MERRKKKSGAKGDDGGGGVVLGNDMPKEVEGNGKEGEGGADDADIHGDVCSIRREKANSKKRKIRRQLMGR